MARKTTKKKSSQVSIETFKKLKAKKNLLNYNLVPKTKIFDNFPNKLPKKI